MQGLCSICARFWAPEKAGVSGEVMQHIRLILGPREGTAEAANSDFAPFVGHPCACRGYVAFVPTLGPRRRQR